jgi:hypothetical protein
MASGSESGWPSFRLAELATWPGQAGDPPLQGPPSHQAQLEIASGLRVELAGVARPGAGRLDHEDVLLTGRASGFGPSPPPSPICRGSWRIIPIPGSHRRGFRALPAVLWVPPSTHWQSCLTTEVCFGARNLLETVKYVSPMDTTTGCSRGCSRLYNHF